VSHGVDRNGSALERLDASEYGDPVWYRGDVAPPCQECGLRPIVDQDRQLCEECAERIDEAGGRE
jgi:hypothetical protein